MRQDLVTGRIFIGDGKEICVQFTLSFVRVSLTPLFNISDNEKKS